jgi:hypothetical protein
MRKGYGRVYAGILFIILVIGIIIYGVLKYAKKEVDSEQFETIKTDMLLIEAKTSIVAQKVKIKEKDAKYIGNKIENDENEDIKKLEEHGIIELKKENNYYILDDNNLDELELSVRNQKQGNYIVEYNSNEIIYTSGIKDKDGNILYKLSDIEKVK